MLASWQSMSTMSRLRAAGAVAALALALAADAHGENVSLTEKPDNVTEATAIIDAPPAQVYELVTDYARWPQILSDVKSVKVEAGGRRDARIRFRSVALEHDVTVEFDNIANREVRFRSVNLIPGAHASGAYVLQPMDGGTRTMVVATLYLHVGGLARAFVSAKKAQAMRQSKLRADLGDVAARFAPQPRAAPR
jgi:uncharacterized membrane protein